MLFNHSSLSYNVLALQPAVTNLLHKTLIFHDFHRPTVEFHDFPGLENKILKIYSMCLSRISMTSTIPRGKESYREKGEMAKNSGKREKLMQKVEGREDLPQVRRVVWITSDRDD